MRLRAALVSGDTIAAAPAAGMIRTPLLLFFTGAGSEEALSCNVLRTSDKSRSR